MQDKPRDNGLNKTESICFVPLAITLTGFEKFNERKLIGIPLVIMGGITGLLATPAYLYYMSHKSTGQSQSTRKRKNKIQDKSLICGGLQSKPN